MRTALIDGDILRYEIGWSCEGTNEEGEEYTSSFDRCAELLDAKIDLIMEECEADDCIIYLTDSAKLAEKQGREYVPNFRLDVAKAKEYKGQRHNKKPFHFDNITHYLIAEYYTKVADDGLEADDWMCIEQKQALDIFGKVACIGVCPRDDGTCCQMSGDHGGCKYDYISDEVTIICSRDKDLRMMPGWHYSWECGKQPSMGPVETDDLGWLEEKPDGKIIGFGNKFFYYQLLVGDAADNIPGLPKWGPKKAYPIIDAISGVESLYWTVRNLYKEHLGDDWLDYFKEQCNLLWMIRERNEDGGPVMYIPPHLKT